MAQGRGRPPQRGGSRSPGSPTLAQATGGRPGRVAPRPAAPKSLGLGLGLGAKQRMGFQQAAQGGQSGQWLAQHPGVQQRIGQINPNTAMGGAQQQRIQNFMGTGQSQRMPRPPQNVPAGAQPSQPQPQAPLQMPQQPPMFQGNRAQGTGDQLTAAGQQQLGVRPYQGWSGDNASMQGQLGQLAGGFQRDPYQQTFNPQQQQGSYQPQNAMGSGSLNAGGYGNMNGGYGYGSRQQPPAPGTAGNMGWFGGQQQARPANPYGAQYGAGAGVGYGGAGYGGQQQPPQAFSQYGREMQQPAPQASYGGGVNYGMGSL